MRSQPSEIEVRSMACPKCGALPHKRCTGRGVNARRMHAERRGSAEEAMNRYTPPSTRFVVNTAGPQSFSWSGGRRTLPLKGCE